MKGKKKLAVLFTAALLALSLGVFAACAEEKHSLTYVGEVAATCTDAGHEAYYLCSHCGKLFADENAETELSDADVTIAALGHDMTHREAVEATCTVDGNIEYWSCSRCNLNFSDEAGTKEVASVTLPAGHDIEWVETVEPTVSSEGMRAHYECSKCHTCYEDVDGKKVIDREDLVLAQLVEQAVTVTVEVYDVSGNKVESPDFDAINGELSLLGAYSDNQYKGLAVANNGTLELDSIIVGEYTVDIYGYRRSTFTVTQGTSEYTLALYATIAYGSGDKVTVDDKTTSITIEGSVTDYQNTAWSGSAELVLSEDIAGSTGVVLEFNVRNVTNSQASGNDEWASQRIAVQMARGYEGFLFFLPSNEANIFDLTDGGIRDEGKTRFGTDGHTFDWINTLMREASGVNMRLVRTGESVTLFVQNAEAEWVKIGTVACADAATDIIIYGCGVEWKFSSVKAGKLTYVPGKEATAEEPGNYAYYTDGTNYWFEDGEQTTEDGVKLYMPVDVTLTVNGIALDGETSEAVAAGTVITFTSRAATYTYTVGEEALTEMVAGGYIVTADGYRTEEITVSPGGGEVEITLTKVISIEGDVADYTGNRWSDSVALDISEELKASTAVILEFNVRNVTNSAAGWPTDEWASQRIAIQMAQGNEGFLFFLPKGEANIFDMTDSSIRNEGKTQFSGSYAWIDTLMRGASGVNMRLVRTGANVTLFVQNAEAEWVKIGTVACGSEATEIVFYGCGVEWEFSFVTAEEITYVPEKEPVSTDKPGNIEYYTDGMTYWLPDGTVTTLEETVVKYEVEVTLTLEGFALDGKTSETVADGTVITFTSDKGSFTYTVGETENFKLSPDTYTVTANGYRTIEVVIPEEGGAIELTLTKVISIEGDVADYTGNRWSDSVALDISEELKASTAVILEFTVKNITNSAAGWPTDEWASQRIAIQMAQGNEGFLFFLPKGEANIFDMTDSSIRNEGKTQFSGSYAWIDTLMRGASGVNMRLVRTGANVTLFVQNAEAEWVKIGTVACGSEATEIVFYGCGVEWEFSFVTAEEITYVPEKEPVSTDKPGNIEYYTDGMTYWLPDGTVTTLEETVVKYEVEVTLTLEGFALDGKTSETVADGTVITFTSDKGSFTYTVGETENFKLSPDTYTVTANGYRTIEVVIPEEGGAIELTLTKVITIGKGATVLTNNAWNGQAQLPVPENLSENFLMEFTLKMSDFTQGWNELGTQQRYAIRLTEGNVGFVFWSWNDGTAKTHIYAFTVNDSVDNLTNAMGQGQDVNGDEAGLGFITNALISENGLQLRILRAGNTFVLYALNGEGWVKLGSVSCEAGDKIDMEVYAGVGAYEWSNVNFTEVTYVSEKEPVSADEPGNIEYYTDGTNYWLPDGTVTTLENTVVKYEVEVTLTLEGFALDGTTTETIADGTVITFTSDKSSFTYTVGETENFKLSPDTYTVTANGYKTASLTVTEGTTEYTLTLYRTIAYASNDKVTVDDKNGTINIKGDVADYTSNQWSGSAELALSDEVKQSTNVTLEFTVKNVTNSQSGWPENEWASQRIAIQMAEGNEGFLFFLPSTETNIFDMTDNGIGDGNKHKFDANGNWINELMRSENGVNMRIVREGANVTLFVQNAEEEWIEIGTVTCASADAVTEIVFYGCGVEWEFSSITVTPNVQE